MTVTIWHKPRCSKSRETLALLQARGIVPVVRLYLTDPPTLADLRDALSRLDAPVRSLVRAAEADFQALNLPPDASDDTLLDLLARHPRLIERPLVLTDRGAAIGRPPEAVLRLL